MAARLIDGLVDLGASVATPRDADQRGPLVCVRSTDVDTLGRELRDERIVTSAREDRLRIALHLYNTDDDVDRILSALRARSHLLA